MSESIQENMPGETNSPNFLRSFWQRRLYGAFMVIMTFLDFQYVTFLGPNWQSGRFPDYIILFLSPEATLLFFPLIAYSIISFLLLMENQEMYANIFVVRLGIYTGAILALQYGLLTILAVRDAALSPVLLVFLIAASPWIVKKGHQWLSRKISPVLIRNLAIGIALLIVLILIIVERDNYAPFLGLLMILGVAAPYLSLLISGQTAVWLFRNHESKQTLFRGLGIVTWLAAYVAALRYDILKMYELYAALPTTPPDCYIATAAAKGHSHFVHSRTIHLRSGDLMQVNSQLEHFKSVEIALMVAFPKTHYFIRKIYDVAGRKLAAHIQNSLLADVAFLLLLPVEWVSFRILKLFIPEIEVISKKIYHS